MLIAEFMRQGYLAAHIRRMRLLYRDQRDFLVAELTRRVGTNVTVQAPPQGMHLVAYLRDGLSDIHVEQVAREHGVIVQAISPLYKAAPGRSGLMLGFSGYSPDAMIPAVERLARIVRKQ